METAPLSLGSHVFLLLIDAIAILLVYSVFKRLKSTSRPPRRFEIGIEELGGFGYGSW
jgi:hypothetical protein